MLDKISTGSTSRRTIVKGAAWSVPVIALASAAPAHASSELPIETVFTASSRISGTGTDGIYNNLSVSAGNVSLSGAPGVTTGTLHTEITLPAGYTHSLSDSFPSSGWVLSVTEKNGRTVLIFTHAALTIPADGSTQIAVFPALTLVGTGASTNNKAAIYTSTETNMDTGETFFPR